MQRAKLYGTHRTACGDLRLIARLIRIGRSLAVPMADASDFLRTVSLFQDLDDETLAALVPMLVIKAVKAGEAIFRELDRSDALYVVEKGQLAASKYVSGETDIVLTRFHPGDFFGEMGLFDSEPRSASVYCEDDAVLWKLDRDVFHSLLNERPEIGARLCYRLVTVFIQRLRATNEQAREAVRWGLEATGFSASNESESFNRRST